MVKTEFYMTRSDGVNLYRTYSAPSSTPLCSRDTVNPVYNPLRELVGLYVEMV